MEIRCNYDVLVLPKELAPHPKNRNKHSKDQIERLAKILEYQGWRYPVKVSKLSGYITSGHGRVLAAKKLKTQVPVNYQDYDDDDQEYADVQSDNAIASWSDLDLEKISADVDSLVDGFDVDLLGIKDFELTPDDKYADKDADSVPEDVEPVVKLGQIWKLGEHRLMCGDATKDVDSLLDGAKIDMVYTDPPYGMNLDTDYSKIKGSSKAIISGGGRKYEPVTGDGDDYDPAPNFLINCKEMFLWGADYYHNKLPPSGSWLVWDKRGSEEADKIIGASFELCWSKNKHKKEVARIKWMGAFGQKEARERVHPTQKPVNLAEWFLTRWGKDTKTVADLYGGSGSSLIACEKTNRKCYMMEIEPKYCDVIIARWQDFTGQTAELIT